MTDAPTTSGREPEPPVRALAERDLLLLLAAALLTLAFDAFVDPDLPGHLAFGLEHLARGLARTDPYSYTAAGAPWINHEWVFEGLIAWVWLRAGTAGLVWLQGLSWLVAGGLLVALLRRATRDVVPSALLLLAGAALLYPAVSIRPQLFTCVAFALLLFVLERARAGSLPGLLALPPLVAAWTNAHGGFLAGVGVLGAFACGVALDAARGRASRRTAGVTLAAAAASAAATLLNPYGLDLHRWLYASLVVPNPHVDEWGAITLDAYGALYVATVGVVAVALFRARATLPASHALVLVATAVVGARHARHAPFLAMAAIAFAGAPVADLYRRLVPRPEGDLTSAQRRRLLALGLVAVGAAALLRVGWPPLSGLWPRLEPRPPAIWPTGAILHLDALLERERAAGAPPRRLLVHFDWAQLAIWRWHPRVLVFYDGRHRTVYDLAIEDAHMAIFDPGTTDLAPGWRRALTDWPTDLVLAPRPSAVDRALRAEQGWRVEYEDALSVVFVRHAGGPAPAAVQGPAVLPALPFETRLFRVP